MLHYFWAIESTEQQQKKYDVIIVLAGNFNDKEAYIEHEKTYRIPIFNYTYLRLIEGLKQIEQHPEAILLYGSSDEQQLEWKLFYQLAQDYSFPTQRLFSLGYVMNTMDEAFHLKKYTNKNFSKEPHILLVTHSIHLKRATRNFSYFFQNIDSTSYTKRDMSFSLADFIPMNYSLFRTREFFYELIAYMKDIFLYHWSYKEKLQK